MANMVRPERPPSFSFNVFQPALKVSAPHVFVPRPKPPVSFPAPWVMPQAMAVGAARLALVVVMAALAAVFLKLHFCGVSLRRCTVPVGSVLWLRVFSVDSLLITVFYRKEIQKSSINAKIFSGFRFC